MNLKAKITIVGAVIAVAFTATVSADEPATADGNRYYSLTRDYKSEISVSDAYLAMEHSKDYKNVSKGPKPVLIDVRTMSEYAAGHPEDAYNVPYPHIKKPGDGLQNGHEDKLYWEVYKAVGGRTDTPIMTLCRTGHRSVLAGNILAKPSNFGINGPAFTNVRNIWEGFVGQPKYAFMTGSDALELAPNCPSGCKLDLNNDKFINSDSADVYTEIKDANPDKDGWRNFAGLPWSPQIQKPLAYERNPDAYKALNLTPVQ
jgi:rhodanese-related sulfurtransferase